MSLRRTSHRLLTTSLRSPARFVTTTISPVPSFGILLDIDGVVTRGKEVLPGVREAFRRLTDPDGRFRVPTVFVTNAGNTMRAHKADSLTKMLGSQIVEEQVIMSHSPLRMFHHFHERHVLVSGQGPILNIARALGFKHVTTVDDLRMAFPGLDCGDFNQKRAAPCSFPEYFPPIEAVILFGEPLRWETALQLIIDVLLTNGNLTGENAQRGFVPYPHLPVLACNADLLFMADTATLPRFAHGTFLHCLEALYHRFTGYELKYTALMGKPNELTYHHAELRIKQEANRIGIPPPDTVYAIGFGGHWSWLSYTKGSRDNPESDVLGANLFQQFLSHRRVHRTVQKERAMELAREEVFSADEFAEAGAYPTPKRSGMSFLEEMEELLDDNPDDLLGDYGLENCYSVLVETGVYSKSCNMNSQQIARAQLGDAVTNQLLKTPTFIERDLLSSVKMIFKREKYFAPDK